MDGNHAASTLDSFLRRGFKRIVSYRDQTWREVDLIARSRVDQSTYRIESTWTKLGLYSILFSVSPQLCSIFTSIYFGSLHFIISKVIRYYFTLSKTLWKWKENFMSRCPIELKHSKSYLSSTDVSHLHRRPIRCKYSLKVRLCCSSEVRLFANLIGALSLISTPPSWFFRGRDSVRLYKQCSGESTVGGGEEEVLLSSTYIHTLKREKSKTETNSCIQHCFLSMMDMQAIHSCYWPQRTFSFAAWPFKLYNYYPLLPNWDPDRGEREEGRKN